METPNQEHLIYENDNTLPSHYDVPCNARLSAERVNELWAMVKAMDERSMVVIVRAMNDGGDNDGQRLMFSTHPDTVVFHAETPGAA